MTKKQKKILVATGEIVAEKAPIVAVNEKYLLTIKEAAAYFNIGEKKLRRLAEDRLGELAVYSGNRYLVIRPKFEQFLLETSTI
jgi:excisionase family DNA binding protein